MKLLFVYNANSGKINALFDAGHKFMSPSTYKCSLCALTFDTFSENRIWKDFRAKSNIDMEFYHKDEFETKFPNNNVVFPAILKHEAHQMSTVLNADVLNEISNVDDLIARLKLQF